VDPSRAVWVVVSVLIVTCPCALSLATPATWVATASGLAQRGVLLRRLESLQAAAGLQQLFLDKTGTLTQAVPQLLHVEPLSADARDLATALALARWSAHPLSRALQQGLPERLAGADAGGATAAFPAGTAVVEHAGQGLQATDTQGRRWRLGSARWAADGVAVVGAAVDVGAAGARAGEPGAESAQLVLACDGAVRLRFAFGEALRPGALDAVAALRERGVALALLSGDSPARARRVAQALGLDDVRAAASPERKLGELRAAQAEGRLCGMLGDGLNDGAVLAAADLGIAMGEGAALAQQQADVVLLQPRLEPLVDLMDTARKSLRIVRQNLVWSAAYNMACIPAALAGWLPPWAAGLGMAASSLLVVLNAQRAAR
jgi:Cu2+-exporting ATPase